MPVFPGFLEIIRVVAIMPLEKRFPTTRIGRGESVFYTTILTTTGLKADKHHLFRYNQKYFFSTYLLPKT